MMKHKDLKQFDLRLAYPLPCSQTVLPACSRDLPSLLCGNFSTMFFRSVRVPCLFFASLVKKRQKLSQGRGKKGLAKIQILNPVHSAKESGKPSAFPVATSAAAFVISMNAKRRHLTPSQKAAAAVLAEPLYAKEARKRQREHGGTAPGRKSLTENLPEVKGESRDQAAQAFGVSGRYVSHAKKLHEEQPELFKEVHKGKKTLQQAKRESGQSYGRGKKKVIAKLQEPILAVKGRSGQNHEQAGVLSNDVRLFSWQPINIML